MNDNFISIMARTGYTVAGLSKKSGVPYQTIKDLKNQYAEINRCNAIVVYKLAAALGVNMEELLDISKEKNYEKKSIFKGNLLKAGSTKKGVSRKYTLTSLENNIDDLMDEMIERNR